jgi:soluble lytic murein transglycosylase-like protein
MENDAMTNTPTGPGDGDRPYGDPGSETDRAAGAAKDAAREAAEKSKGRLEAQKHAAAAKADAIAGAARRAAHELEAEDQEVLSGYTRDLASGIEELSKRLRGASVDSLLADARDYARRNPAMFVIGSVALGFGLSRFLKASSEPTREHESAYPGDSETRGVHTEPSLDTPASPAAPVTGYPEPPHH